MRTPAIAMSVCLIGLSGCVVHVQESGRGEGWAYREGSALELVIRAQSPVTVDSGATMVGTWSGEGTFAEPPLYSQRYYALEVRGDPVSGTRRSEVRPLDDVAGLPPAGGEYDERLMALRLTRDAGTLVLEGEKEGKHGEGRVLFEKNADFEALVTALAGRTVEVGELASLAYANVRRADVESLRAANQTATPAELIRLRDRGVSGEYVRELAASGQAFTLDDAGRLRDAGIKPDFVRETREAGLSPSIDELIRLRNNGVNPGFVRALRAPDGSIPALPEIIRLRNSGVSAEYISGLRAAGYDLSTEEMIRLSHSSVSPGYARGVKEAGYDLSVDELIKLRNSGVSVKYITDICEPGYERLPIEQVIEAKNKGLSAEFVRKLRQRS
jgi:hypothetical protein